MALVENIMDSIPDDFIRRQAVRGEAAIFNAEPIYPLPHEKTRLPKILPIEKTIKEVSIEEEDTQKLEKEESFDKEESFNELLPKVKQK